MPPPHRRADLINFCAQHKIHGTLNVPLRTLRRQALQQDATGHGAHRDTDMPQLSIDLTRASNILRQDARMEELVECHPVWAKAFLTHLLHQLLLASVDVGLEQCVAAHNVKAVDTRISAKSRRAPAASPLATNAQTIKCHRLVVKIPVLASPRTTTVHAFPRSSDRPKVLESADSAAHKSTSSRIGSRCTSLGKSVHEAVHVLGIVADLQTCEFRPCGGDHPGFHCEAKDRNHSGAGQRGEGERRMCSSASDRLPQLAAEAANVARKAGDTAPERAPLRLRSAPSHRSEL